MRPFRYILLCAVICGVGGAAAAQGRLRDYRSPSIERHLDTLKDSPSLEVPRLDTPELTPGDLQLDDATRNLDQAVPNALQSERGRRPSIDPSLLKESKRCLTPAGSCELKSPSLNGTTCFCQIDSRPFFGKVY